MKKYASIVLDDIKKTLTYEIPHSLIDKVKIGSYVEIPLRNLLKKGVVSNIVTKTNIKKVKLIKNILSEKVIPKELFTLSLWISKYYISPLSKVFKSISPKKLRQETLPKFQNFLTLKKSKRESLKHYSTLIKKNPLQAHILSLFFKEKKGLFLQDILKITNSSKSPIDSLIKKNLLKQKKVFLDENDILNNFEYFKTKPKILNEEQKKAFDKIKKDLKEKNFNVHLLFGITGSGKTEIYLQAIEKALSLKKTILMLVPEISLTSQTIERFKMRFSEKIAIIHHKRSSSEKFSDWQDLHSGKIKIVIGARSAIFAPLKNLGLIIVDEEHDSSYKQSEDSPTYNAKNLAVIRGKLSKAPVILGSATPSIESFYNAKKNKYILSTLLTRPTKATLPKVHIVDMKREKHFLFSEKLLSSIKKRLDLGEQVILFLNRRGYSNFLICSNCSNIIKCPHCDLSLTFHKNQNILLCHSCDYKIIPPKICPLCKSFQQEKKGYGTEKVEATLKAIFKGIRTLRMDKDTTSKKNSHEILFKEFKAGKADVLIGTQMIVKGLHFPSVTLVGVLNSDAALNIPDFRASENVFQLITQVAGRAGREDLEGEVVIQTNMPENSTIQLAAKQNFLSFYSKELENRKIFSYPPFSKIIKFTFLGLDENKTKIFAENFKNFLIKNLPSDTKIHPIIPSIRPKQKDFYRFILLIRGKNVLFLSKAIKEIQKNFHLPTSLKLFIDVDPIWCL